MEFTARQDAIESGSIEAITDGKTITVLIDRKPVLIVAAKPFPHTKFSDGTVSVKNRESVAASFQADDAELIADLLANILDCSIARTSST